MLLTKYGLSDPGMPSWNPLFLDTSINAKDKLQDMFRQMQWAQTVAGLKALLYTAS